MMDQIKQMTIIGTGLLGASCGLGLRAAGFGGRLVGIGRRWEIVERARQLGCIDEAGTDIGAAVRNSQLVLLATPLSAFEAILEQLAKHDHPDLVVTDVGSTKQAVCADVRRLLPHPARFVGSHPMAGGEQHGPDAARADLFKGKPCILTPEPDADPDAVRTVESLWTMLQMRLIRMPACEHDQHVARISHLPHALASLLLELAVQHRSLRLASTGFRDTTRVASADPRVWLDIFATNRQAVIETIDAFTQQLAAFRRTLSQGNDQDLLALLDQTKQMRDQWIQSLEGV